MAPAAIPPKPPGAACGGAAIGGGAGEAGAIGAGATGAARAQGEGEKLASAGADDANATGTPDGACWIGGGGP